MMLQIMVHYCTGCTLRLQKTTITSLSTVKKGYAEFFTYLTVRYEKDSGRIILLQRWQSLDKMQTGMGFESIESNL